MGKAIVGSSRPNRVRPVVRRMDQKMRRHCEQMAAQFRAGLAASNAARAIAKAA